MTAMTILISIGRDVKQKCRVANNNQKRKLTNNNNNTSCSESISNYGKSSAKPHTLRCLPIEVCVMRIHSQKLNQIPFAIIAKFRTNERMRSQSVCDGWRGNITEIGCHDDVFAYENQLNSISTMKCDKIFSENWSRQNTKCEESAQTTNKFCHVAAATARTLPKMEESMPKPNRNTSTWLFGKFIWCCQRKITPRNAVEIRKVANRWQRTEKL